MNFRILNLLIRYSATSIIVALVLMFVASLIITFSSIHTLSACYLFVYLGLSAVGLLQMRIIPVYNSFLTIPPRIVAFYNHALILIYTLVGIVPFLLIRQIRFGDIVPALPDITTTLLLAFAVSFMLLGFVVKTPFFPIAYSVVILNLTKRTIFPPAFLEFNRWAWPAYILIILIAILEFPQFLKITNKEQSEVMSPFKPDNIFGPKGPHPLTQLRGALIWLSFGLILLFSLSFDKEDRIKLPTVAVSILLGFAALIAYLFSILRRAARASGLKPAMANIYALTALFGVGYCYRFSFGVRDGEPVRCLNCGDWCMVWMRQCPHCSGKLEEVRSIPPSRYVETKVATMFTSDVMQGDQLKVAYRFGIIGLLLLVWWFNYMNSR